MEQGLLTFIIVDNYLVDDYLAKERYILTNFNEFDFHPTIIKAINGLGFEKATPIQEQAIPLVLEGHDIMGLAQTGTGKTAAFGLPLVQHLIKELDRPENKTTRSLILAPTRELANQIADNMRTYVRHTHLKVNVVVGGSSIQIQRQKLGRGTDILIATPGRLMDLVDRKAIYLDTVKYLVLDEADQMLDLGFIHVLQEIAQMLGTPRQTMMFSATMPKSISVLSKAFLKDPKRVEVSPQGTAADKVKQSVHFIGSRAKADLLKECLNEDKNHLALVFSRTKHGAEKLMKHLKDKGFKTDSIHGNKSQGQRDRAIRKFRSGETRVLVATDVAARGIDIPNVSHVFNYDLPEMAENYVHRIGRTARAGASGQAIAFCPPSDISLLRAIEKLMGITIEIASGEISKEEEKANSKKNPRSRNRVKSRNKDRSRSGGGAGDGSRATNGGKKKRDGRNSRSKDSYRSDSRKPYRSKNSNENANEGERKRNTYRPERLEEGSENKSNAKTFKRRDPKNFSKAGMGAKRPTADNSNNSNSNNDGNENANRKPKSFKKKWANKSAGESGNPAKRNEQKQRPTDAPSTSKKRKGKDIGKNKFTRSRNKGSAAA